MIIACDLDRTLLPNGTAPDDGSLPKFFAALAETNHMLIYVTGRNLDLVRKATETYGLHVPDFLIGDVGTTIYKKDASKALAPFRPWREHLDKHMPHWDWGTIVREIPQSPTLYLQEPWRQNPFKCSYYALVTNQMESEEKVTNIKDILEALEVDAQVVYSEDPIKHVGLIDILPTPATKLTALQFLSEHFDMEWKHEVLYCGDSGNDILPLTSGCKAVVVNNADAAIKQTIEKTAQEKGILEQVYIARGSKEGNGNYAAGVIEGLRHHGALKT